MSYSNRASHKQQQYQQFQHYQHHAQQQQQVQQVQQMQHAHHAHPQHAHRQSHRNRHQQSQAQPQQQHHQQQQPQSHKQKAQAPLPHNGQTSLRQRRSSKVPLRELPKAMPAVQHPVYPQLYTVEQPAATCYKWDCIILDLDRTIIHGKRLSVKRWRKYVENGTIPSLAENQCSKWHRHIHRKGHQMHPFIRGRTMIYYRPFTWHLLAVLDYLKSHFGTKIIVCTKAGEHYAASVLAALISNFTSANPDLIDDVYNFHDLHDDPEEEGKPKKPFRLICNRHDIDPKKTLIVDDNATSWFGADREMTNFWMPPCYGYQIHDIDNELQLLCKYLWDPVQQNHLRKKALSAKQAEQERQQLKLAQEQQQQMLRAKRYQEEQAQAQLLKQASVKHAQQLSQHSSVSTDKQEIVSRTSPKSVSGGGQGQQRFLNSPNHTPKTSSAGGSLQFHQSVSYSTNSSAPDSVQLVMSHNGQNSVEKQQLSELIDEEQLALQRSKVTSMPRISRGYNKRKYKEMPHNCVALPLDDNVSASRQSQSHSHSHGRRSGASSPKRTSPRSPGTKTKKKGYFFESKSRGSKKLAKIIGK